MGKNSILEKEEVRLLQNGLNLFLLMVIVKIL